MTRMVVDISCARAMSQATIATRAHGVVVSHPLRMRKALGSNPSGSSLCGAWAVARSLTIVTIHIYNLHSSSPMDKTAVVCLGVVLGVAGSIPGGAFVGAHQT